MTEQVSDDDRQIVADVLADYGDALMVDMSVFLSDLHSEFGDFERALETIASLDADYNMTVMHSDDIPFDVRTDGYYLLLRESDLPE